MRRSPSAVPRSPSSRSHANAHIQSRQRPERPSQAGPGDRRAPYRSPHQARTTPRAHNNLGNALRTRASSTRRSPSTVPRCGIKPDSAEAHHNLGIALRARASWTRRSPSTARRSGIKPDFAQAHYNLGNALREQGNRTRPSPSTARRSGSSPTTPSAHNNLGSRPKRTGQARRGHRRVPHGVRLKPDSRRGPHQPRRWP